MEHIKLLKIAFIGLLILCHWQCTQCVKPYSTKAYLTDGIRATSSSLTFCVKNILKMAIMYMGTVDILLDVNRLIMFSSI